MARASEVDDSFYRAAQRFVDSCLRTPHALFRPDAEVWTADVVADLYERVVGHPDFSKGPDFIEKLKGQVQDAPDPVVELAAEMLYILLLAQATNPKKKRDSVQSVLAVATEPVAMPDELLTALSHGFSSFGGALVQRFYQYCFLLEFAKAWTELDQSEQSQLLEEPETFREFSRGLNAKGAASQVEALLYIVFPDYFEPITSVEAKERIVQAFAADAGEATLPVDMRLTLIRSSLSAQYGEGFSFYDDGLRQRWEHTAGPAEPQDQPAEDGWTEFIRWATKLYDYEQFDDVERDYKLATAAELRQARQTLQGGGDWLPLVQKAFKGTNLLDWRYVSAFVDWAASDRNAADVAVGALWSGPAVETTQIDDFDASLPQDVQTGTRLAIASVLCGAIDPTVYPPYRARPDQNARKLLGIPRRAQALEVTEGRTYRPDELAAELGVAGRTVRGFLRERYPRPPGEKNTDWALDTKLAQAVVDRFRPGATSGAGAGARYQEFLDLGDELTQRMRDAGTDLRDRLDAQSLLWWISSGDPPENWSELEKAAFLAYQHGETTPSDSQPNEPQEGPTGATVVPPIDESLADRLFLPRAWLQQAVALLNDKRQVIFYGPPGTGKTFVAKALGEHVEAHGGGYRLVQFHPTYSYEDFFEGYRPTDQDGDGTLRFDLRPGPLRLLADEATKNPDVPFLLVVDEINRGNVAKIFGELYFLLEYRDEPIQLQYSPNADFRLPPNLFVIGTMNTADRSIALVDTALRRRFYFLPFTPTEPPVRDVLAAWLIANGHDDEPSRLLHALNTALKQALPDDEFSIGPSYLMSRSGPPDLERVWRYAIAPLLEERFYGARTRADLEQEFGLAALRKSASPAREEIEEDEEEEPSSDLP